MSTIAISSLPVTTVPTALDVFPIVQNNVTSQITNADLFGAVPELEVVGGSTLATLTVVGASVLPTVNGLKLGAVGNTPNNVAIGNNSQALITTGQGNVGVGDSSVRLNISGSYNTGIGSSALQQTTGSYNTAIGNNSGTGITTGSKNVIIGGYKGALTPILQTGTNYVVLSDGDANVRAYWNGADATFNGGLTLSGVIQTPGVTSTGAITATSVTTSQFTSMSGGVNVIASASNITPVKEITTISGTAAIATINPQFPVVDSNGTIILIPTGAFTWTTAGNIAVAGTAVVGRALHMTYVQNALKWYPSYV